MSSPFVHRDDIKEKYIIRLGADTKNVVYSFHTLKADLQETKKLVIGQFRSIDTRIRKLEVVMGSTLEEIFAYYLTFFKNFDHIDEPAVENMVGEFGKVSVLNAAKKMYSVLSSVESDDSIREKLASVIELLER